MAASRRWVTTTAASVLGVGVIAVGAIGAAQAMPLVDSTVVAVVPPIAVQPAAGGVAPGETPASPAPLPSPSGSDAPGSTPTVGTTPAASPQPVAPRAPAPVPTSSASPASPLTPASPAAVDD